jgi:hypothetical protein
VKEGGPESPDSEASCIMGYGILQSVVDSGMQSKLVVLGLALCTCVQGC